MRDPSVGRLTIFEGIVRVDFGVPPGDAHFDYRKFRTNPVEVINTKNNIRTTELIQEIHLCHDDFLTIPFFRWGYSPFGNFCHKQSSHSVTYKASNL